MPTQSSVVKHTKNTRIAVIGGTGLDECADFLRGTNQVVQGRYGDVRVFHCTLAGVHFWFLPRHGTGHHTPPHSINYRAQIAGLKNLGVQRVIGICSVGSLRPQIPPGSFAVLTDFIDLTRGRARTLFDGDDAVRHTDFSQPYCPQISDVLTECCREKRLQCCKATYAGVEGPRYETPAEVRLFASWGADVVGMTNVPEVIFAREAGLCYGALALVTNYGAGLSLKKISHEEVRKHFAVSSDDLLCVLSVALARLEQQNACLCCAQGW